MYLVEDTRQQIWAGDKHSNIRDYCARNGIVIIRQPLAFGDYALARQDEEGNLLYESIDRGLVAIENAVVVDTKKDILEISYNLMSRDHARVREECLKAQSEGSELIFLIEEVPPCGMLELWESPKFSQTTRYHRRGRPMTMANPANLRKVMKTMEERYGCQFRFCDKAQTGRHLIEYLTGKRR